METRQLEMTRIVHLSSFSAAPPARCALRGLPTSGPQDRAGAGAPDGRRWVGAEHDGTAPGISRWPLLEAANVTKRRRQQWASQCAAEQYDDELLDDRVGLRLVHFSAQGINHPLPLGQCSFSSWPYMPNVAFHTEHQGVPMLAEVGRLVVAIA